jgi:glycosyltransferase involved in cell wall biosynthesis
MRVAYIAAGAGGMYCGSCMHDNTLAAALMRKGVDVALIPTYTPLRTDETNVSLDHLFYGGINIFLQEKLGLFRHTPRFVDWLFDRPGLVRWVSDRFSASTNAADLGALTVSVLSGEAGHQHKALAQMTDWIAHHHQPHLVQLTNSMFAGTARYLKAQLGVPILCAVQGEELFLDALPEPHRTRAREVLRERSRDVDGFIAPCQYYADFMAAYLAVPPSRFHVVKLGVSPPDSAESAARVGPFTIGYLARVAPEKGLHLLIEACRLLSVNVGPQAMRLKVAGWLGQQDRPYFEAALSLVRSAGLEASFSYEGEVDSIGKSDFLNSIHMLCVPTAFQEPKGLYVLEALSHGVPVVQPAHGAFPELVEATGGGLLVTPDSASELAAAMAQLMEDDDRRVELGSRGRCAVIDQFNDDVMAANTMAVYKQYL